MIRRQFMQLAAFSTLGALKPIEAIAATGSGTTIVLEVKGFTCPTCAVGLDTLLAKESGIISCHSTYPEGRVTVTFDPKNSSEEAIRKFIGEMGFSVVGSHRA